jgi:hypothetical protein
MPVPRRLLHGLLLVSLALSVAVPHVQAQDQPAWVPPYPGPVPTSWPSVLEYEQYAQQRARLLEARELGLTSAGRSEHYHLQRNALLTAVAVGAAMAASGLLVFWSRPSDDQEPRTSRAITALLLGGAGLTLVAGVGAHSLRRKNPYNDEIAHLSQERLYWRRELKRVRRERKRGLDLSFSGLSLYARF